MMQQTASLAAIEGASNVTAVREGMVSNEKTTAAQSAAAINNQVYGGQ